MTLQDKISLAETRRNATIKEANEYKGAISVDGISTGGTEIQRGVLTMLISINHELAMANLIEIEKLNMMGTVPK